MEAPHHMCIIPCFAGQPALASSPPLDAEEETFVEARGDGREPSCRVRRRHPLGHIQRWVHEHESLHAKRHHPGICLGEWELAFSTVTVHLRRNMIEPFDGVRCKSSRACPAAATVAQLSAYGVVWLHEGSCHHRHFLSVQGAINSALSAAGGRWTSATGDGVRCCSLRNHGSRAAILTPRIGPACAGGACTLQSHAHWCDSRWRRGDHR
jgi:hypothetical protein